MLLVRYIDWPPRARCLLLKDQFGGSRAVVCSRCRARICLWGGIRQRYSNPGANAKHLNVKSVISTPKSLNIEIRSSVQQRPIFTLIYHGCPCTQGLITLYMVNKPLTCSRQCVMGPKANCLHLPVVPSNHFSWGPPETP